MLSDDLTRYVELRRSVGFKFRVQHTLLKSFVVFAEARGDDVVLRHSAFEWAKRAPTPMQRRNRLLHVRRFALAMHAEDVRHDIPPADGLGRSRFQRRLPHIFTSDEIARLMAAAAALKPTKSIKPLMYELMFGLLAATGIRISEALSLRLGDVTPDGLVIRQTKFHKSRLIPLHATTQRALDNYLAVRMRLGVLDGALLISDTLARPAYSTVVATFLRLARAVGIRKGPGQGGPRIHDLRHTFAVRSLEQCGQDRLSVDRHITALSTYLGHAHVTDTYWYLQSTPLLMTQIAGAGQALHGGGAA